MANEGISAVVKDGQLQAQTASQISLSADKTKANSSSALDKDAFLQLLVAQMKYQDPLEPTDNTEYISQLATFSQLEEMQNMTAGMSLQRASGLVGQEVVCKVINSQTGRTEYAQGYVDYVVYENNKAYVSVNDSLYSVDDVYQVIDPEFSAAYDLAKRFATAMASLPEVDKVTTDYAETIEALRKTYDSMSTYEKSFISHDMEALLSKYEAKMKTILGEE